MTKTLLVTMTKTLIVTVGLPRSGKTTWARKRGYPIVNPDSIRLAMHSQRFAERAEPLVWAVAVYMVRALFLAGHDTVIVDGCHVTGKRRDFWRVHFQEDPGMECNVTFEYFWTDKETCIARAREIADEEIIPIIERMASTQDFMETDRSINKPSREGAEGKTTGFVEKLGDTVKCCRKNLVTVGRKEGVPCADCGRVWFVQERMGGCAPRYPGSSTESDLCGKAE